MKTLLVSIVLLLSSTILKSQERNAFFSDHILILDPGESPSEKNSYNRDAKILVDYTLKIIKVNFLDQEFVYSFYNIERIETGELFFEFNRGQSFTNMMYSSSKNYVMFNPYNNKKEATMYFTNLKLLY